MNSPRIPLFPLGVVLFPAAPLPLHIFEPRYKLMIGHCIEHRQEFGMVLARKDGIAAVGCTAEIIKVVKRYDDGRMDILTMGQTPFQVKEVQHDQPYFEADVEFLDDDTTPAALETQHKLIDVYLRSYSIIHERPAGVLELAADTSLAYRIASELPLDLDSKQALLEIRSEAERQQRLLDELEEWLPQIERMRRARKKGGGNGHAL